MGAIKVHHTPTSDGSWDGPGNEKKLKDDGDEGYYKKMYAWQDPDKDPETKGAYKFPHHEVDGEGDIGAANIKALQSIIGILNGGMGGAKIPDDDRQGVYNHASAHLKDADEDVPELKSKGVPERRSWQSEIRTQRNDGEPPKIVGYAAVFDKWYEEPDLGFREKVRKGAFAKTIKEADIRALWNHNPDYVLGRTKNGTLILKEDDKGLWMEVIPPETQWAQDLVKSIERGDVDQQSFGFRVIKEAWESTPKWEERELIEVHLFDVSPVTFPAYEDTIAQVRSLLEREGIDFDRLSKALEQKKRWGMTEKDHEQIRSAIDALQRYLPEPPKMGHSDPQEPVKKNLDILRKKLDLVEATFR